MSAKELIIIEHYDLRRQDGLVYDHTREENPNPDNTQMHAHTQIEIYFLIEGTVEYHIENNTYIPKPGDILIIRPGEIHNSMPAPNQPYERIIVRFPPELLRENSCAHLLAPFLDRPLGVLNHYSASELPSDFVRACFDRMFLHKDAGSYMRTTAYLLPILQEIYDTWQSKDQLLKQKTNPLPAQIISYINKNLACLQNPKQISDAFFMSQSQIYRIFRKYTGISVWDYVRTRRLFTARELLQSGMNPHQAAVESGYTDYSTFYRGYMKQFGHSPQKDQRDS